MSQRREYVVGASTLNVEFGDLLTSTTEVLVSSDDLWISMGGGVSGAIRRAAGTAIVVDAAKSVPRQFGDVVVTTAGALPARYVFHVITIGTDRPATDEPLRMIATATRRCLDLLEQLGVTSIAFPALGTGAARLPLEQVAAGMTEAILERFEETAHPLRVELYLQPKRWQSDGDYIVFFEELARRVSVASARRAPAADPASRSAPSVDRHEPATQRLLEAESRRSQLEIELEASRERSGAEDPALARRFVEATHHVMDAINERRPLRLFVSYSHADDEHATQLVQHMASLRNEGLATWYDRRIQPGADWENEISVALDESDVAIFLISAAFLSSPYCTGVEWQRAVERARQGRLVIVPVIVRACDWKHLVGHVQVLPHDGKPVASHPDRDEAYLEVVTQMKELILTLRRARSQESSR